MNPMTIGWIVLTCVFGGALLGMVLHRILPAHHLSTDSKDVIKLGMGLTATMSALVLALLIASPAVAAQQSATEGDYYAPAATITQQPTAAQTKEAEQGDFYTPTGN